MAGLFSEAQADLEAGKWQEAHDKLMRLLAAASDHLKAPLFNMMAQVEEHRGNALAAQEAWRAALAINPDDNEALARLALNYHRAGKRALAGPLYEKLITRAPTIDALNNYGALLREEKRYDEARVILDRALALAPDNAAIRINKAHLLFDTSQVEEAEQAYKTALEKAPMAKDVLNNLGLLCHKRGDLAQAEVYFRDALATGPQNAQDAETLSNLGALLTERSHFAEAETYLEQALALGPSSASAHYNRGLWLLTQGRLIEGWQEIEWRWRPGMTSAAAPRLPAFDKPMWRGENLQNKTILVLAEQAFGDEIMLMRYVKLFAEAGARVFWATRQPLLTFFERLPEITHALLLEDAANAALQADYWAFAMSLPGLFHTTLETIPTPIKPPLDPERCLFWRDWLQAQLSPQEPQTRLIGLNGTGKPYPPGRSVSLLSLLKALEGPNAPQNVRFISLSREKGPQAELEILNQQRPDNPILDAGKEIQTFADTAALLEALDLLITIDSAPAHLAGTLGLPTWLLLKTGPDWRWFRGRLDSPFYPSLRLFRQENENDWTAPLAALSKAFDTY